MNIRQATPSDYDRIHAFVREAFRTARVSDGNEQDFVLRLRDGASVPELELIAEEEESLLGPIMLTDAVIRHADAEIPALLLAPLSVALERRGQGIGAALVREALNRAAGLGHARVVLVGDSAYYSRFGFRKAAPVYYSGIPEEHVLALELAPGSLHGVRGEIHPGIRSNSTHQGDPS